MEKSASLGNPLVILNPTANRGKMDRYRALTRAWVIQEQAEYVETAQPGDAREHATRAARDGRAVVIVGGDGSVHEVVNGILAAGRRVPLGIVAAGSGNDYAWNTLKLPRSPEAALERAFHGQAVDMDAGVMNGRYFANSCSVGLDADIAAAANRMKTWPLMSGSRLYYASTLRQLCFGYHHCPWLNFTLDSDTQTDKAEKQYVLLAVTNGPTYGGGFRINPTADAGDGLLDVCTIKYAPLLRALKLLPVVQKGEHAACPEVTFYRAKTVHIECRQSVNMQMDGEVLRGASFKIELVAGALLVRM